MPHLLPKKQNKIQPANKKASANFSGAKIRSAHFSAGGIFVSGLAGQRPRVQRFPAACTFPSGASRPTSSISIHQPQRPTRQLPNAFLQLRFSRRENTRCIFGSIQNHRFRLGRPIPPATILSIPAPQSSISQLPSSRLGRPTPYITSHHFFNIYKAPSSPTYSRRISAISTSPFHSSTHLPFSIFYIAVNILPVFAFPYLHPTTFPTPSTSSVLLPLLQPAGQTRNVVSRAGAACKAADGAGEEPAFLFFSFFFYFFLLLSFLYPFSSPWRRGFAATPSFFFLLLFFFLFFLFAFIFAFFFLLFSIYFSSDFLFLFFLCPFFLLFLSFYFCSYLCFLFFIFIFVFLLSFYFCFSFSFFCLSFCFTFLPSLLQSLSSLSNRSPTIHFFYSAANLSHSIQPLPAAAKKKKNIGKRIHGG